MTTYRATCDRHGCTTSGPEAPDRASARTAALEAGWRSVRTSDYLLVDFCPEHAEPRPPG